MVERPVATALVSKLPSGVINLICEFVGLEKKKTAEELKLFINLAVTRGARAIDHANPNRFLRGQEPEYYIEPLLKFWFGRKSKKKGQQKPERVTDYVRKMCNRELNKNTTEEKLIILKARFERQPVNIQREILAMPLSSSKVKHICIRGRCQKKNKEEVRDYNDYRGYWGGFLT